MRRNTLARHVARALEGALILFAIALFRLMPLDLASYFGGLLLRHAGPHSKAHKTARNNLEKIMPELSDSERQNILNGMWDNIGRVIGEYPHLARPAMKKRVSIEGQESIDQVLASGKAVVIVSGHFANWEIAPLALFTGGLPTVVIYREANNPVAAWLSRTIRSNHTRSLHSKGREGAVQSIKALKDGHPLALLIDQKMNDGSPIPFFGRDAMTAIAAARLAVRFQTPILAGRVVRHKGAHFTLVIEPLIYPSVDDDPIEVTTYLNQIVERWVREHPAQWFWVHRRWGKNL